jgi:hypothetical protein
VPLHQPPNVKDVVDRITGTPLDELAGVLQGFNWSYDKVRRAPQPLCLHCGVVLRRRPCLACALTVRLRCLQGDINHWVDVLDHFDSFLEQRVSQRADVQLRVQQGAPADPPFPTATCLAVLSATCVLLENCSNKAAYNSSEVGGWAHHGPRRPPAAWRMCDRSALQHPCTGPWGVARPLATHMVCARCRCPAARSLAPSLPHST